MFALDPAAESASLDGAERPRRLGVTRKSALWPFSKSVEANSQVTLLSTFRGRSDRRCRSKSSRVSDVDASAMVAKEDGEKGEDGGRFSVINLFADLSEQSRNAGRRTVW